MTPRPGLAARVAGANRPIVLDSAFGTRLIARGLDLGSTLPAELVLDDPEAILELHRLDVAAGAEHLLTATFVPLISRWGKSAARLERLHRSAVALAVAAIGDRDRVIGSIAPESPAAVEPALAPLAWFAEEGVSTVVAETCSLDFAASWLPKARARFSGTIVVSLHETVADLESAAATLFALGADLVGSNCRSDLEATSGDLEALARGGAGRPLWVRPGGGLPGAPAIAPDRFAARVDAWRRLGVAAFGGCCGTDDRHVAALRRAVDALDLGDSGGSGGAKDAARR
ncbi:MAG: homocysteine S-methyltransferase family protein [Isosphaeraceae bacterium]|nr:homocysteine S-methyltransferase family protein [Isosphaeraceae bacterium]